MIIDLRVTLYRKPPYATLRASASATAQYVQYTAQYPVPSTQYPVLSTQYHVPIVPTTQYP